MTVIEHPWMTFFVAMTLAGGIADGLRRLCKRPVRR
jgi:hypothetical protein